MRNRYKIVLDTNIFINGWFFPKEHKNCVDVLNLIRNKQIQLLFAQDTIGELVYVTKNFARHYISDVKFRILLLEQIMKSFYYSMSINTKDTNSPEINDKYDNMFLRCAIQGNADYLISDDFKSGMHSVEEFCFKVLSAKDFCELVD